MKITPNQINMPYKSKNQTAFANNTNNYMQSLQENDNLTTDKVLNRKIKNESLALGLLVIGFLGEAFLHKKEPNFNWQSIKNYFKESPIIGLGIFAYAGSIIGKLDVKNEINQK